MNRRIKRGERKLAWIDSRFEENILIPLRKNIMKTKIRTKEPSSFELTGILADIMPNLDFNVDLIISNNKKKRGHREVKITM